MGRVKPGHRGAQSVKSRRCFQKNGLIEAVKYFREVKEDLNLAKWFPVMSLSWCIGSDTVSF